VQHYTICDGWIPFTTIYDENNVGSPYNHETYQEAINEIIEFMQDIQDQIDYGERSVEDGFTIDEFDIYDLWEERYCDLGGLYADPRIHPNWM
jgi:hypothetical protein